MTDVGTSSDDWGWSRVVTLYARIERELQKLLQRQHGLGLSEYRALCHLASTEAGELRIQELADLVGLNESTASRLVARLEGAGFVQRDHCPDDRRGVYAVITAEGRDRHRLAQPTYLMGLAEALDEAAGDQQVGAWVSTLRHTSQTELARVVTLRHSTGIGTADPVPTPG